MKTAQVELKYGRQSNSVFTVCLCSPENEGFSREEDEDDQLIAVLEVSRDHEEPDDLERSDLSDTATRRLLPGDLGPRVAAGTVCVAGAARSHCSPRQSRRVWPRLAV